MASIFGSFGYQPVFVYIAACWVIVAITVAVFGPRTGMLHLETLNDARVAAIGPGQAIASPKRRDELPRDGDHRVDLR